MFVVTGVLQAVLLGLAIYYYVVGRRKMREEVQAEVGGEEEGGDGEVDERTALLGNADGSAKRGAERSQRQRPFSYDAATAERESNPGPGGGSGT